MRIIILLLQHAEAAKKNQKTNKQKTILKLYLYAEKLVQNKIWEK